MSIKELKFNQVLSYKVETMMSITGADGYSHNIPDVVSTMLAQGSISGKIAEIIAGKLIFSEVCHYVSTKGHDFVGITSDRKVEAKALTNYGLKLCPSSMIGAGRKIDKEQHKRDAVDKDFIVVDVRSLSKDGLIKYVVLSGEMVAGLSPSLGVKAAEKLFQLPDGENVNW